MKKLSRRAFLQGAGGAALSLPWMESLALAAPATAPAHRMVVFYVPIGPARNGFFPGETEDPPKITGVGATIEGKFTKTGWHDLQLTPTLQPLKQIQKKVTLITGMDRTFQEGSDLHAQCASCFLSSAAPNDNAIASAWPLDRTLDHVVADQIGTRTPFQTLEFSCNSHKDNREPMYFDNVSWYGTGHVAPSMRDPRFAYERLFNTKDHTISKDITNLVFEDARSLQRQLGRSDKRKFEEYFDAIRTIEKRIDKLKSMRKELAEAGFEEPPESRLPRAEYIQLMNDLMVVALQTGLTRVATMMIAPERWDTPYVYDGLFDKPKSHHQLSHNQPGTTADLLKIDRFHMEQFADLIEKIDGISEADGSTMLDNTLMTYGSGIGDSASHQYNDLPIVVAGGNSLGFRSGQHLHCADKTPLANLWLTQARSLGLKLDRFADSTGTLNQLLRA